MEKHYLAKSRRYNRGQAEYLEDHIRFILLEYERLKELYPSSLSPKEWELLKETCIYHDMGKIHTPMQGKLDGREIAYEGKEVQHGYLSPAFLPYQEYMKRYTKEDIMLIVQAIFYHHNRPEEEQIHIASAIRDDLMPKYESLSIPYIQKSTGLTDVYLDLCRRETTLDTDEKKQFYLNYIMMKGLLNKIDYAASGHFNIELPPENVGEVAQSFIDNLPGGRGLNKMQLFMKEHQNDSVVAIASTGIGKTEGGLVWIGNNKAIFSLPLTTSINAMYSRLRKKMNLERIGLLHANMLSQLIKEKEKSHDSSMELDLTIYNQMKQFSMPLTVSTIDQFVDFIFGYAGSEMKYATLKYSKLVVDEIQMYQPNLLAYLLIALSKVQKIGGSFAIITATFPPVFEHFMKQLDISYVKPPEPFIKENKEGKHMVRHYIRPVAKTLEIDDLATHVDLNKKTLIIANTIKHAQKLYHECQTLYKEQKHKVHLLHSRFIKKHRSEKEEQILKMGKLDSQDSGIWITTSLVEASVDIDFDVLVTELTEIMSLLQRLGRAYRNREYQKDEPNVFIYTGKPYPSGISPKSDYSIVDIKLFELSKSVLEKFGEGLLEETEKMNMVDTVYSVEALKGSDYFRAIAKNIDDYSDVLPFEMEKKDIDLRGIDSEASIPKQIYDENRAELEEQLNIFKTERNYVQKMKAKDKIDAFTVNVPRSRIQSSKDIEYLELSPRMRIPIVRYEYTEKLGLMYRDYHPEDIHS